MWEALLYAVFFFLTTLGLIELVRSLESLRLYRRSRGNAFLVLPLQGEAEHAEALLREGILALEELSVYNGQMILVDCGMSDELRQLCELFCRDYSCAHLFASDEICGIIDREL